MSTFDNLVRAFAVIVTAAIAAACGGGSRTAPAAVDNAELIKPKLPPPRAALPAAAVNVQWRVTSSGVGPLSLGAPVPEPAAGFVSTYTTSYYADAQPLEGFAFSDPPAAAFVKGGPFSKYGYEHVGETAPAKIKQKAIGLAKAGKLPIDMLVITDPRPKTGHGVGVGDTYATFAQLNPSAAKPQHFPGLWEEPSCVISEDTVWYFFDNCEALDQAKVLRIVVKTEDQTGEDQPSQVAKNGSAKKKAAKKGD